MPTAKISQKGWVVIPADYRRKYGLKPGMRVEFVDYGGGLSVVPVPKDPIRAARGLLRGRTSLTRALLRERAKDRARE
ncbi:MAG TPA: AbrB/MazE/SpoVT family DNA-binding domain-containing protein [Phycisphaerae bacterium]|nr:AbrB/MazE/SpoVT family DNA-binding domain-containing protein [Phycisphaerae bacterium]